MNLHRRFVHVSFAFVCSAATLFATSARAGALEECMTAGDRGAVSTCLLNEDRKANEELNAAEAAAAQRARALESATGRSGAHAALAKSVKDFAQYRTSQCAYVKETYASGTGADEAMIACRIDLTRQRVRALKS
jgi:uncharacterized protein YecT (DUF1311 family)